MVVPSLDGSDWETNKNYSIYTKPLEKPANDERDYRLIRLNNQLEALIISDPEEDLASAAMDVHVGSLSDPDDLLGLAHFCEHLLFMGTKKYPKENDYWTYLAEHSGDAKAFTKSENTNYCFDVGHQYLKGALDRFSRFFIDPLFLESCIERELRAVDSEHKKNLQSDNWRNVQIERQLSNTASPWHRFNIGSLETLSETPKKLGLNIKQELLKFHEKYYSANIMKLCVVGREPLDQLTEWVVEKFSGIINKNISVPSFPGSLLTKNELMKQIFVKSVQNIRTLDIVFPFPDQGSYYESQPAAYIPHLIAHEGSEPFLSDLENRNWATRLDSYLINEIAGSSFFRIKVILTEQGLEHYEDVVVLIFQCIAMLKEEGAKEWIFEEIKSLSEINFRFSEKCSSLQYTSDLSEQMQKDLPAQYKVSGGSLFRKYDPTLIEQHLALLRPDSFRLILTCQEFPNGIKCTKVEKWYSTEYDELPIGQGLLNRLNNISLNEKKTSCGYIIFSLLNLRQKFLHINKKKKNSLNDEFRLPGINEFIPSELDVEKFEVKKKKIQPDLIQNSPVSRTWYKQDDTFWQPKTNVWILLRNPLMNANLRYSLMFELYTSLVSYFLTDYTYETEVSGLQYSLNQDRDGIILSVCGYSHKLPLLLEKIVNMMTYMEICEEHFDIIKDKLQKMYENLLIRYPYHLATLYEDYALGKKLWTTADSLAELKNISMKELQSYVPVILSALHIETFIHGNIGREQALSISEMVQTILKPHPILPSQLVRSRAIILPKGHKYVYQQFVHEAKDVNSAIRHLSQICDKSDIKLRNRLYLLEQIAEEACFHQLRTIEHLGYLVWANSKNHSGRLSFSVTIQSERDTIYLENRILEFLDFLREKIQIMDEEEYQTHVDSLITSKLGKYCNMNDESDALWSHIKGGYYEFNATETDVAEIKDITKESFLEFYDQFISPRSKVSRTFSVHMRSQISPKKQDEEKFNVELVYHVLSFLKLINKDELSQDKFEAKVEEFEVAANNIEAEANDLDTSINTEAGLAKFLSSTMFIDTHDIVKVIETMKKGPSALSERDHTKLPEGYILISDLNQFKSRMELSAAATPFIDFFNSNYKPDYLRPSLRYGILWEK